MRVVTLDSNLKIIVIKDVGEECILSPNDIVTELGEMGQIKQLDGTFINDPTPVINIEPVTDNTLKILKTISTIQPQDVTVTDKTDYWDVVVTRNITTQVVEGTTYYSYEFIETNLPKSSDTLEQVQAVLLAKKDVLFSDAEYPAYNTYDANTSSTDLLKLVFTLIDTNKSLTSRVTALEAK